MATKIAATDYKDLGFPTKKSALEFKKEMNINLDNRVKSKVDRDYFYMKELEAAYDDYLDNQITNSIIREDIRGFNNNKDKNNVLELIFPIKYLVDFKGKTVEKDYNLDPIKIEKIISQIRSQRGTRMVLELTKKDIVVKEEGVELEEAIDYFTISNDFIEALKNRDSEDYYLVEYNFSDVTKMRIVKEDTKKYVNYKNKEGAFFPYNLIINDNKLSKTLSKYQIYKHINKELNNIHNCFVYTLMKSEKISDKVINNIKLCIRNSHITIQNIKDFTEKYGFSVIIHSKTDEHRKKRIGKKGPVIEIGHVENHYFLNEKTDICLYAIKNYNKMKDEKEWWTYSDKTNRNRGRGISSYKLITYLVENKEVFLEPIKCSSQSLGIIANDNIDYKTINLDNRKDLADYEEIEEDKKEESAEKWRNKVIHHIEKKDNNFFKKISSHVGSKKFSCIYTYNAINVNCFFDIETNTGGSNHKAYLLSYSIDIQSFRETKTYKDAYTIRGDDCTLQLLETIVKKVTKFVEELNGTIKQYKPLITINLIAHNVTYDIQFLLKHCNYINLIERASNMVCGGSLRYKDLEFKIRDTYALIPTKLSSFNDFFKLENDNVKEVIPYSIYNKDKYIEKSSFSIDKACKMLKRELLFKGLDKKIVDEKIETLKNNIEKWNLDDNKKFDHIEYSSNYCKQDVKLMKEGYNVFSKWISKDLGLNVDDYLTVSSLADQYFVKNGAYQGCYKIKAIARYFIQQCVVGGRCMSNQNKMYKLNERLSDFDGVSLYPSAIERLEKDLGGFLKGKPKMIEKKDLNMEFLNKQDGYFIQIRIKNIPKARDFPLQSYKDPVTGVRNFTNDLTGKDNYIDKIALEDFMEFQGLTEKDFTIINGYYFNEGRNNKCGALIRHLFNRRLGYKKNKNPIEKLYKLIMNSCYGKNILKEQNKNKVYVQSKENFEKYLLKNYNHIVKATKLSGCEIYKIETRKAIDDHYNSVHIGAEILSMSKRIMNEVMCLAEDNDIKIYYQDTDSMHIMNDELDRLAVLFKEKYDRELVGKHLGQFHSDFENLKVDDKFLDANAAIKTIILGKKCYIDVVEYKDGDKVYYNNHFKMKGIPSKVIELYAKNHYDNDVFKLYEDLYNGESINFDLLSCGFKFSFSDDHTVKNEEKFTREISFVNKEETQIKLNDKDIKQFKKAKVIRLDNDLKMYYELSKEIKSIDKEINKIYNFNI
jgi:hypothetical protein